MRPTSCPPGFAGELASAGVGDALETRPVFPLIHTIAVDNPEHCILAGTMYGYGTNCQCSACLTPKDALGDLPAAARFPMRTMQMHKALQEALDDNTGAKAVGLYKSHLEAATSDAHAGAKRKRAGGALSDAAPSPSVKDAMAWVTETFKSMSYRMGIRPALHDFPAAGGGYAILGLSYDRLHMARLGAFKRLCILALAVYAKELGVKDAIDTLNTRFSSRGKHDGLDRCVLPPFIGRAEHADGS